MTARRTAATVALIAAAAATQAAPASGAPRPFLDVRDRPAGPRVAVGVRPLTPPGAGSPAAIAGRFVRRGAGALRLGAAGAAALEEVRRTAIPGGGTLVAYRSYAGEIPSFDGGVRVLVGRDGGVLAAIGAAERDLDLNATAPRLTAADAMRRLMADVGVRRAISVTRGPAGPRLQTAFAGGESAALVAFGGRLGWQLDYRAEPLAHYAAVVDAVTGEVLYRANRVKSAANDALVWEQFPGAPNGGTAQLRDLTPYLRPGDDDLSGPFAHAWSDLNDNDTAVPSPDGHIVPLDAPDFGEKVTRTGTGGSFSFPFDEFTPAENPAGACQADRKCSWNFDTANSWRTNRAQNAVQAFYFVNRFRDHLAAAPISFSAADGDFRDGDRVLVNTDDGAAGPGGRPNAQHRNNAYMDTPPDGRSPTMAMFLFFNDGDFRDVNGGDDAAIVYHEYTHGLSNRLVTVAPGGEQALNAPQAGAMGEGWSDFYAKDFLVGQFPADDTAAPGEVDMGEYLDSAPNSIRTQPLDCPVGAVPAACPGIPSMGSGGYTYGDYNTAPIDPNTGAQEVHVAGEIWAETLWDLRGAVGPEIARAIVTQGMRLSPPEPTFLEARDAILLADRQLFPQGDHSGALWGVFATRGMGADASSPTGTAVVPGSKRPPTAALAVAPGSAATGQAVTLDASASSDADGAVAGFSFDVDGDGDDEVSGASPRTTVAYPAPGTFRPVVTVRDDEGRVDTASATVVVAPASAPAGGGAAAAPPTAGGTPARRAPAITLRRTGTRGRIRLTVRCDSACSGTVRLTVTRRLARRLGLGGTRQVGRARVRLAAAGSRSFTVRLSRAARRAVRLQGGRRLAVRVSAVVTDADRRRTARSVAARIRR